ncbi:hypothetical protein [Azospirillum sp. TSA6c]|uniref:hypothetical protein n=1 Tax=unclassified Azospirillum TaxID=2630922 RepID=UPI000D60E80A|nr:hypothetical protein [Azospirillum sp. TSA6c]PWC52036.1 hypothetical protein TSA6c_27895 [Azospirillum sp. TSA6c]
MTAEDRSASRTSNAQSDAPSEAAQRIEDKLVDRTGKAAGDPDKPVQKKWEEMGEREEIAEQSQREGGGA